MPAFILIFPLNNTRSAAFTELHNKALKYNLDGLWAQISEDTTNGLMGIINKLPQDEASINALMDEMNELNKLVEAKQSHRAKKTAITSKEI